MRALVGGSGHVLSAKLAVEAAWSWLALRQKARLWLDYSLALTRALELPLRSMLRVFVVSSEVTNGAEECWQMLLLHVTHSRFTDLPPISHTMKNACLSIPLSSWLAFNYQFASWASPAVWQM